MKFCEFFVAVCDCLQKRYGFKAPGRHLVAKCELLDLVYHGYQLAITDDCSEEPSWIVCIGTTAYKIAREDNALEQSCIGKTDQEN